jgi:Fe-S-cluster-containing dehydrogenase component
MFACSRINTGYASLERSAIKIRTQGGIEGDPVIIVCHDCDDPACVRACPTGALSKRPGASVLFKKDLCDGCGMCADACLIGAISLDLDKKAVKCKHCGACVAFCPHDVLLLVEVAG